MNGIDAERNKLDESPADAARRHEARGYRKGYFIGMDLANGPDSTVYSCKHGHSETPCRACFPVPQPEKSP